MTDEPAIAGGARAITEPYGSEPRYGAEELAELQEALAQGTLFYAAGQKVRALEAAFAAHCGAAHAVACSSGTAAIHAALIALGVSPGDEVVVSPVTDMGGVIPVLYQGATPAFADLDPHSGLMTAASVEAAITPATRAVVAVHLGGCACDVDGIAAVCRRAGVPLVEDCAQALGCQYGGRIVGTSGVAGCFSLNEFKHISCGDGGIVVTDDGALAARLRLATDKAYDRTPGAAERNPAFLAGNYRMTELQGAVALAQLRKLDAIVARRRGWCGALRDAIADVAGLTVQPAPPGCDPSWWFLALTVDPPALGADASTFAAALSAEGVPAGAHYIGKPVYAYPIFAKRSAFARGAFPDREYAACPGAESFLEHVVIIMVNEAYTEPNLRETAHAIRRVAAWYAGRHEPAPGAAEAGAIR